MVIGKVALALVWFSTEGIQALMDFWQVTEPLLDGVIAQMLNFVKIIMQVVTGDWDGAWQSIKDGFALGWETIKKTFKGFANWVTGWFGTSWNAVVEQWRGNWELLKEIVTLAWANIRGKFYGFLARIIVWVTTKWAEFTNTWRGNWELLKAIPGAALEAIRTLVAEKWAAFVEQWRGNWELLKSIPGLVFEALKTLVDEKITAVRETILGILRGLFESMGLDFDEMRARWAAIWNDVHLIVLTIWERLRDAVSEKFDAVRQICHRQANGGPQFYYGVLEATALFWSEKWTAVKTKLSEIWLAMTTAVGMKVLEVYTAVHEKSQELQTWWDTKWDEVSTKLSGYFIYSSDGNGHGLHLERE
ncbi:MAG: hypothetical protein IPH82_29445 [Chloroflexi bacterium]|nr:hypothetical protein [Chloroflexota bacterium]